MVPSLYFSSTVGFGFHTYTGMVIFNTDEWVEEIFTNSHQFWWPNRSTMRIWWLGKNNSIELVNIEFNQPDCKSNDRCENIVRIFKNYEIQEVSNITYFVSRQI